MKPESLETPEEYGYKIENGICLFNRGPLSQWWGVFPGQYSLFIDDSLTSYNCCEQFMMVNKALLFNANDINLDICNQILAEKYPSKQKELGRQIKNFDQTVWNECKYKLVFRGNLMKFQQNAHLGDFLRQFPIDTIFAEATPWDRIWGTGLDISSPFAFDMNNWPGQNLLGKVISKVRQYI